MSVLIIFASYLNLIVCFKVFPIGKFEKVHEFNRVWALILSPTNNFLTNVCLWYRACLQRPMYGISVFLVRSIHGPTAFLIKSIHRPRAFLLCRMSVRRAFFARSCYGFYLWQGWSQGCALVSYPWVVNSGLPINLCRDYLHLNVWFFLLWNKT